jgi:hypothetical protein
MIKVPKSLMLGGKRIKIRVVPELDSWGEYHHDLGVILLATRATTKLSVLRDTLRHEMMHAALDISGVGFAEQLDEESVVRCFDEIFFPAYEKLCAVLSPK